MTPPPIRLAVGDAVAWRASPTGFAQVEFLHRTRVTIGYRRRGRWKRARVKAAELVIEPMLIALDNPFDRGRMRQSKVFESEGS